uniref:Uncharacterized protein n=1 Tax=Aegilops tauschii subsp. strangulata TaxID=200361 RepID=A0A453FF94_AEGTS
MKQGLLHMDQHHVVDRKHNLPIWFLQEVVSECQDMNWGTFKATLTDALIDHLQPIQV